MVRKKQRLESAIQGDGIKLLKARPNTVTYKHPPSPTGIPDVHHCEAGVSIWFEFKRTKKHKPSKLQKRMHKKLRKAGHVVVVVWKLSQVKKALKLHIK